MYVHVPFPNNPIAAAAGAAAAVGRKNHGSAFGQHTPAADSPVGWCRCRILQLCHSHHSTAAAAAMILKLEEEKKGQHGK